MAVLSVQETIERARIALALVADYTQEQIDHLVYVSAKAIYDNAEPLARLAVDETKLGKYEHKIAKNRDTATVFYDYLRDKKSVGIISDRSEDGIVLVAHPAGVIAAVTPATNPTITPLGNFMHAVKGRNALVVSPAPRSEKTTSYTIELIREALAAADAPSDLIQVVEETSVEKSRELMTASDLVIATGGFGLTKAAYSSGKPAYGVAGGNPPVILDRDYDFVDAAQQTFMAVGYDNGILCDGDNLLLYPQDAEQEVFDALVGAGIHIFDKKEDVDSIREVLFPAGKTNAGLSGKDALAIVRAAGLSAPATTEVIGVKIDAIGNQEILTHEIMAPIVVLKGYETFEEAVESAARNLSESGGLGHTAGIFSNNLAHIRYAGENIPVSRLLVNQPTPDAWGPTTNGLTPAVSEGCGTWGNNILSANVDYTHLINISRIAFPLDVDMPDGSRVF